MTDKLAMLDELQSLLDEGAKTRKAETKANRQRRGKPKQVKVEKITPTGETISIMQDARLHDGKWADEARIMLMRETRCKCGQIHSAPNEYIMVRKSHPTHGIHEEAISVHDAKFDHLPLRMETRVTEIYVCPSCIEVSGYASTSHNAQTDLFDQEPEYVPPPVDMDEVTAVEVDELETTDLDDLFAENAEALAGL